MKREVKYWFPVRRSGLGWGLPTSWQGWLVFAAYAASLGALFVLFPPGASHGRFLVGVVVATALFALVCWLKGEPLRWRWGGK